MKNKAFITLLMQYVLPLRYIEVLVIGMKQYLGNNNNFTDNALKTIVQRGLHNTKAFLLLPRLQKSNSEYKYERVVQKGKI